MKVKKIMNWPLTIFTLLAMAAISMFGMDLSTDAFFSEFGREHIDYDLSTDSLCTSLENDFNNRLRNVDGLAGIVSSGMCKDELGLIAILDSVISEGDWDEYGYVELNGEGGTAGTVDGNHVKISKYDNLGKLIYAKKDVFWEKQEEKTYLYFTRDVVMNQTKLRLFFVVSAEKLLTNALSKSEITDNPVALTDAYGNVYATANMDTPFDYSSLTAEDFYFNPTGEVTGDFVQRIQKNYMDKGMFFEFEGVALDAAGQKHDVEMSMNASYKQPIKFIVDGVMVPDANTYRLVLDKKDDYSVRLSDKCLWFKKTVSFENMGMVNLLSGKPKIISGSMLQQTVRIMGMYSFGLLLLFVMFVMQLCFTVHSNRKLVNIAYVDHITKYRNWNRFVLDATKLLKKRKNRKYVMVVFDIDRFNVYNDLYGHNEGNLLLENVARYFSGQMKKKEIFARCGADHFTMFLNWEKEEELDVRILHMKQQLLQSFSNRSVRFTVGAYKIMDYSQSVDKMYTLTSIAQEDAKLHRDREISYFNDEQRQKLIREKELENSMVAALKNREFHVYLQPKYYSDGSRIGGAEALVRWISKDLGFISPGDFIPLFEKNGFIIRLDNYMLDAVCALQRHWMDEGKELITVSVNISRVHLLDNHLVEDVKRIVDAYQLPHSCIELELTESAFFDAKDILIKTIKEFREMGFEVSMDDFGSGYSSLNSLKDLPLDVIKLDGEFFRDTDDTERGSRIVTDTIRLAKHLNMRIVAEGVEKKEQVDFLQGIGCDLIQGFYFAKPMPVADFEKLWMERNAK